MQHKSQSVVTSCSDRSAPLSRAVILPIEVWSNHDLSFLMEAHDRSSGAITERAGLKGLWTSGPSIACSHGHHNPNEASANQLVDLGSTEPPVLVHGHSDFRKLDNGRLPVRKLHQSRSLDANSLELGPY